MKINFIIDPKFIAITLIVRDEFNNSNDFISIINNLKESYFKEYVEINDLPRKEFISNINNILLEKFMGTEIFKKMLNETEIYCNKIKDYWIKKENYINKFLQKILKISINKVMQAYITHPLAYIGTSIDNDCFYWGHIIGETDPNYNIVCLIHEALHNILPYTKNMTKDQAYNLHSIIELISDYELYSILSKKSKINEGHSFLVENKLNIYSYWLDYIGLTEEQKINRMKFDNINNYSLINENLFTLNIYEFIDYINNCNFNLSKK